MTITILYGSQTGNAEDLAKRIGLQAKVRGLKATVMCMDDFHLATLTKQQFVLFVCSTTGHGQEPENMRKLYTLMRRRDLPKQCLSQLKYAVYGLGDSSYAKFNYVSKILFRRLEDCGAGPIQNLVLGDEQHYLGADGIIYPQLDQLWPKLMEQFKHVQTANPNEETTSNLSYSCDNPHEGSQHPDVIFTDEYVIRHNIKTAQCIKNQRLTCPSHFQDTRLLCFKANDIIKYEAGDVCAILPQNLDENVDEFLALLSLDPDTRLRVTKKDPSYMINYLYDFIPDGIKLRDIVKCYLDIQSVPRRSFFEHLWPLSDDELERGKLKEFASTEGQEEMYEYCVQPKRSITEVLADFPKTRANVKIDHLFDLVPPMKPRSFSIASSSNLHPNEIHLIVGVVNYKTRMKKTRRGLCSNYLANLKFADGLHPGDRINFFINHTPFKLPANNETPIIMIGPGLGIAPFRSFIGELAGRNCAKTAAHLYFGCRYNDRDFYFQEELNQYVDRGIIKLRVAFSREDPKKYIQDLLLEDAKIVNELIDECQAVIYVAGNSKLPEDLRKTLAKILSSDKNLSDDSGLKKVDSLEASNRIQYDCW